MNKNEMEETTETQDSVSESDENTGSKFLTDLNTAEGWEEFEIGFLTEQIMMQNEKLGFKPSPPISPTPEQEQNYGSNNDDEDDPNNVIWNHMKKDPKDDFSGDSDELDFMGDGDDNLKGDEDDADFEFDDLNESPGTGGSHGAITDANELVKQGFTLTSNPGGIYDSNKDNRMYGDEDEEGEDGDGNLFISSMLSKVSEKKAKLQGRKA